MQQEAEGSRTRRRKPDMALYVPKARREREAKAAGDARVGHRREPENHCLVQDAGWGSGEGQRPSPRARTQAGRAARRENKVDSGPKELQTASARHSHRMGGSCPIALESLEASPSVCEPCPDPAVAQPWDRQDKASHEGPGELSHGHRMIRTEPDPPSPPSAQTGAVKATPEPGDDPTSPTPAASPALVCQTGLSDVLEHLGDSTPDPAGNLSQSLGEAVLESEGVGNHDRVPRLVGLKAWEEEREEDRSLLAEQSKGCATGLLKEEETWGGRAELPGESTLCAPGASCEPVLLGGSVGSVPVLPGGSTPRQGMGSPSQLLPMMEESTAGAGDPGGEGDLVSAVEKAGSTSASACRDGSAGAESSPWDGALLESCEPPLPLELLCHGMEGISPASWAKELARPDEDMGSLQKHQEAEKEEKGLHSSSPKEGQSSASAETLSQTSPGAEESWDVLFNDDGDCLDPRLLEEIPVWSLVLPEPSELLAGGGSCLGRVQALGKMELLLINKKTKKISNVFPVSKSLCNADSWQRARFMTFCGGEISDSGQLFNLAGKKHHSEHHWLEAETRQIQSRNQFEHRVIKHCDHFLAGSVDSPSGGAARPGLRCVRAQGCGISEQPRTPLTCSGRSVSLESSEM
ncbi:coiled-coil domain-containing protein R3HCC1L isoform X2 [Corvus moneduloides]|uniref:coiled-coil domain-containing protein R3HCC1L isoform X2 n=1 Tax=Corvus moneduloides TaxID=1196302 RepID=UPI0013624C06|nr:coiled-coil domain-containing protein R3HCC1L isoform X2 [Corvus moneduloides]